MKYLIILAIITISPCFADPIQDAQSALDAAKQFYIDDTKFYQKISDTLDNIHSALIHQQDGNMSQYDIDTLITAGLDPYSQSAYDSYYIIYASDILSVETFFSTTVQDQYLNDIQAAQDALDALIAASNSQNQFTIPSIGPDIGSAMSDAISIYASYVELCVGGFIAFYLIFWSLSGWIYNSAFAERLNKGAKGISDIYR